MVVSLLLSACKPSDTAAPTATVNAIPTVTNVVVRTTPQPIPADGVIDDFEGASTAWVAGQPPQVSDSSASGVAPATAHATRGRQALQLSFAPANQNRAVFYVERGLDLAGAQDLEFDLYNADGAAAAVSLALSTGPDDAWHESPPVDLKPGANGLHFDLTASTFKTAAAQWKYEAALGTPNDARQLSIVVYPYRAGSVFVDKLIARVAPADRSSAIPAPAGPTAIAIQAPQGPAYEYSPLEFRIATPVSATNPFDPRQVDMELRITSPSGAEIKVPAFYDQEYDLATRQPVGAPSWLARFTPPQEGVWRAEATVRTPALELTSQPVTLQVKPAVARGFVRISPDNPRYLAFDNGEAFMPVGLNLGWWQQDALQDYARWFDALQRNGANVARIWMAPWAFGIETTDLGLGRYRLDRAWLLDQVFRMAEQRGIYIILVLLNHGAFNVIVNPEWVSNPYNAEQGGPDQKPEDFATDARSRQLFQQRLRYIAARWGYSPNLLAWEWWNEVDLTPLGSPDLLNPWLREMTAYLRPLDPARHLTSISFARSSLFGYTLTTDARTYALPEIDLMQRHAYSTIDPLRGMPADYRELAAVAPKPVLYTEFGSAASGETVSPYDPEGIHFHDGLWASAFSGFASTALYWWWDVYIEPNGYWDHLKGLSRFLAAEDLGTMAPLSATVSGAQALALRSDTRALVWLRDRQYSLEGSESAYRQAMLAGKDVAQWRYEPALVATATLTLTGLHDGAYQVRWYDPRSGDRSGDRSGGLFDEQTATARSGNLILAAPPFRRDLAIKLVRMTP
jgi:hypothetical protein